MRLHVLPKSLVVCRLPPHAEPPAWARGPLVSLTRTPDELSVVCGERESEPPPGIACERGFRALRVDGRLDFALVGVLASLLDPLARADVSVLALSTYDTDYLLVRDDALGVALEALRAAGHEVEP